MQIEIKMTYLTDDIFVMLGMPSLWLYFISPLYSAFCSFSGGYFFFLFFFFNLFWLLSDTVSLTFSLNSPPALDVLPFYMVKILEIQL